MERSTQKNGLINLLALLASTLTLGVLVAVTQAWTLRPATLFLLSGILIAIVSWFQMRLEESERLERLEVDELNRNNPASATLFTAGDSEILPARRAREQFEKWFVPGFTLLLLAAQAAAAWWLWKQVGSATPATLFQGRLAMAVLGLSALILFLLGKYSTGLARLEGQRLLRPGASHLLLGAYINLTATLAIAGAELGFTRVDVYAARTLVLILALCALELLVNLILEVYRPRVRGQAARILYDSRLIGLLGQPEGLFTTAAHALDYQFGFKVSETWFYRFLERAIAWILLVQIGLLAASTTFVIIEPTEQALLERFGKPVDGQQVLQPGLHFKLPWPIDKVYRYPTHEIQSFVIGVVPDPELDKQRVSLWTKPHNKEEYNLLVAKGASATAENTPAGAPRDQAVPVNLLTVSIPVQYRVTNVLDWATRHAEGPELLENLATREVVRYLVSVDLDALMGPGRLEAASELQRRIQQRATDARLGTEIVFVGLQDIHPPVKVAKDYEEVIGAMQEKETNVLAARTYAALYLPYAYAEATNLLTRAESDRLAKLATVMAEATLFTNQMIANKLAPSVYTNRAYLDTIARAVASARKYVITTTNTSDSIQLNLEDKLRPDLLDVPTPSKDRR